MSKTKTKLHESIKFWLMELGASQKDKHKKYYRCYSGDGEPVIAQLKRRQIAYHPDVVWEHPGQSVVFELAFTEDWRAIAGEVLLAALSRKAAKVFIITNYEDPAVSSMVSILYDWTKEQDLLKWGCEHIVVTGIEDAKRKLRRLLRDRGYIW